MATFYRDLAKKSKDVFKKGYPVDVYEFEVKMNTDDDVDFKGVGKKSRDKDGKNTAGVDLELSKKFKPFGVKAKGTFKSSKEFTFQTDFEPKQAPGLKVTGKAEHKKNALGFKVCADYERAIGTATGELAFNSKGLQDFSATASLSRFGFTLGFAGNYKLAEKGGIENYGGKLDYSTKEWQCTLSADHKIGKKEKDPASDIVGVNFYHKYSKEIQVGADFDVDVASNELPVNAQVGLAWSYAPSSKFNGKIHSSGALTLAHEQTLNDHVKFTFATEKNLMDEGIKFGAGFYFD